MVKVKLKLCALQKNHSRDCGFFISYFMMNAYIGFTLYSLCFHIYRLKSQKSKNMPFTPLHLGIGASLKAVQTQRFSLMVFAGTQVLMDIEPLLGLILKWNTLHLYTHNLLGAVVIAAIAALFGRPSSQFVLKKLSYKNWKITWKVAISSAVFGSLSHVLLDAFMHHDMYPFFPFSMSNPMLHLVDYNVIFWGCILSLLIGGIISIIRIFNDRTERSNNEK